MGFPVYSMRAYRDFVNRLFGAVNHSLLNDELRDELKIELETYDHEMMCHVEKRYSDTMYPECYIPRNPDEAIIGGARVVYLLTHPRHWRVNVLENTKDNINRVLEGLRYSRAR